jgi:hypothetical protein
MKPETEATMKRVVIIFIIMATFFAMLIAALSFFMSPQNPAEASLPTETSINPNGERKVVTSEIPLNPTAQVDSAQSYGTFGEIAENFERLSYSRELTEAERLSYMERAAEAYVLQAEQAQREGLPDSLRREALFHAKRLAPPGTPVADKIELEVRKIG